MKTIEVVIAADGSVSVETKGVVGAGCEALSKAIEDALGVTVANTRKAEFHQTANISQQAKAGAQ